MTEIKEGLNKWKDIVCTPVIRLDIVRVIIFPILVYKFKAMPIKTPASFFAETDKLILKFIQNCKGPRIAKTILKKKNEIRGHTFPYFKI